MIKTGSLQKSCKLGSQQKYYLTNEIATKMNYFLVHIFLVQCFPGFVLVIVEVSPTNRAVSKCSKSFSMVGITY